MALKHLNKDCSVEILMQKAKELNFTKNGEIFDGKLTRINPELEQAVKFVVYQFSVSIKSDSWLVMY